MSETISWKFASRMPLVRNWTKWKVTRSHVSVTFLPKQKAKRTQRKNCLDRLTFGHRAQPMLTDGSCDQSHQDVRSVHGDETYRQKNVRCWRECRDGLSLNDWRASLHIDNCIQYVSKCSRLKGIWLDVISLAYKKDTLLDFA